MEEAFCVALQGCPLRLVQGCVIPALDSPNLGEAFLAFSVLTTTSAQRFSWQETSLWHLRIPAILFRVRRRRRVGCGKGAEFSRSTTVRQHTAEFKVWTYKTQKEVMEMEVSLQKLVWMSSVWW